MWDLVQLAQVKAIMEQKGLHKTRHFRHTKTVSDYVVFSSPLVLQRLAFFIYNLYSVCQHFPTPCTDDVD